MSDDPNNHVIKAWQYAQDVVDGEITACKLTIRACQRFLDDLERDDWEYVLDADAAERACNFIESLPHVKGEWAKRRELLSLEGWQCFIVVNTFGWVDAAGLRRFRTVYIEVARKNAKSTLAAAIALYMLTEDGEAGAEVYSAATTRNQAKIVFGVARQMALRTAELPLEVRAHNINMLETASKFEALHSQGETLDGHNIHCAINDELHAWKDRNHYGVIETATGSRAQPLMFNITTAGFDNSGICYELRDYLVRLLEKKATDESFFGVVYTLDDNDDWMDRDVWIKANPNLGVSVYPMDIESQARKAEEMPGEQNGFLTKRMNVWCSAAIAWMNMRKWAQCEDHEMSLEDFHGEECFVGIDLASKIDVCSMAQLFVRYIDGQEHLYVFMRHWLPEKAVEDDPTGNYDGWERSGHLRTTPGNVIDVDRIEHDTMDEVVAPFRVRELAVDPLHNSTQYGVHMAQQGLTVIDVRPTVLNFSEALKWCEALVKDGRLHHNCPVLTWMIANVEVKPDYKDNIFPRKGKNQQRKIDGAIALFMAINRYKAGGESYFPGEGLVIV